MRLLPLFLLLAGCAAPQAAGPSRDEQALARGLAGRTPGPPQSCIPTSPSNALTVADQRTLIYRQGRTLWVNRVECSQLRPLDTLIVEAQGSRYCRNDRFRTRQTGSSIPGPTCLLGDFVPYRR